MHLFTWALKGPAGTYGMADLDVEALKTLQSIEKLLKGASVLSGNRQTFSSKMSAKDKADKEARKAFKAVAAGAKETNDSVLGLNKGLISLNTEVGETTKSFGSLNVQMAKFMTSLQPVEIPAQEHAAPRADGLMRMLGVIHTSFITETRTSASRIVDAIKGIPAAPAAPAPQAAPAGLFAGIFRPARKEAQDAIKPVAKDLNDFRVPFNLTAGRMLENFGKGATAGGFVAKALGNLWEATKKVTTDFFVLSRIGMGSMSNLTDLYVNAGLAGMSLKEYTEVIRANVTAVSRAGTLDAFDKMASASDKTLAQMGIFGSEARVLQASLLQSSTMMGIKTGDLVDTVAKQIDVFDQLRKSSNMTADEFAAVTKKLSENEDVQKELIGLAPRQRAARAQELLQLQTVGTRLGLTADASNKLGEALIKQRQSTVSQKFDQNAAVLQAAAFSGMGELGQRFMELNLKGRKRTAADLEEQSKIVNTLGSSIEGLIENGGLGEQNQAELLRGALEKSGLQGMLDTGREAVLAQDSGKVNQEAFGKHVGEFGQAVGRMLTWARGLQESIAGPILGAISGAVGAMFIRPLTRAVMSAAAGASGGAGTAIASEAAATGSMMQKLLSPLQALKSGIGGLFSSFMGWTKSIGAAFNEFRGISGVANAIGVGAQGIWSGLGSIAAGVGNFLSKFGPLAGAFAAAFELFTGDVSNALNPEGGVFNRIGGMITAFFSAIPNFIIDTLAWVFGPSALQPIRNGFDTFVAFMNMAIKDFLARAVGGIGDLLASILPSDSKLVKTLKGWQTGLQDSAMENAVAVEKLWNDQSKTLASISDDNRKTVEKKTQATETATKKATVAQDKFNNVMFSDQVTSAGLLTDARALVGSPQVQVPATIAPAQVNTSETPAAAAAKDKTPAAPDNGEMLNVLQAMLQVLRDNLALEGRQAEASEALLRLSRPGTSFQSSEAVADKLLRRGYA